MLFIIKIIQSLLKDESFKNQFQNNIEKLKLIHLNAFQLLINVYNCFDEETELREIICSNEFNKLKIFYAFQNYFQVTQKQRHAKACNDYFGHSNSL